MPAGIAITFPTSPIQGQEYLASNGFTYVYDSQKNRWDRAGSFVRPPKVLTFAGVAATTTGSGITTGPNGSLIYNIPGFLIPSSDVGVDSYKAYRTTDSYPNYTEIQVSISSAFSTIAYAATSTSTTFSIPAGTLSGDAIYYVRARQFVGSDASSAGVGAISGYSANIVSFATTSTFIDAPTIVSIAGTTRFPVYQIGFAGTTLPATVTYTGSGVGNLDKVEWRITGPRIPSSTGDTALAEVGIGTHSSTTLANALVLAMPFSGASGVGITSDVNNAIRTASGASAGTTKTVTAVGGIGTATVAGLALTSHFYPSAAFFDGSNDYLTTSVSSDFNISTGDWTIEFWDYTITSGNRTFVHFNAGGSNGLHIWRNSSNQLVIDDGATPQSAFISNLPLNIWTHYSFVRTSNIIFVYINGILSGTSSVSPASSDRITIGNYIAVSYFKSGYLQDFKIYKGLAKYTENFTPPLPTYGTISYTTGTTYTGINTTAFFESTGDIPTAEVAIGSSTAAQVASSLVLAMPMNRTFGFQDINVAIRGLTSGASAGTAKTVGLGTTSTANAPSHPRISSTESKWYDAAAYFDNFDYLSIPNTSDMQLNGVDWTIEMWINPIGDYSWYNTIIAKRDVGTEWEIYLRLSTGVLSYYNGTNYESSATPPPNKWSHIAATSQGGVIKLFLNGVVVLSVSAATNSGSNQVTIGTWSNEYYRGYIQDLKIYKGFAKYTANFTPPRPICGFTTDITTQTGFTTTTATGALLSSTVGLGTTSTLAFSADQNLIGVTSITSSSGITTLPDPYAQNLVLALPLANITGAGNSFTNDRNTQIRSVSLLAGGTTKTITNNTVTTSTSVTKWYPNSGSFNGSSSHLAVTASSDFDLNTRNWTVECWFYANALGGALYQNGFEVSNDNNIQLTTGSVMNYQFFTGGSNIGGNGTIPLSTNTWTHVAYVRNGSTITGYINGILDRTITSTGSVSSTTSSYWSPTIGARTNNGRSQIQTYFNGYIQDFAVHVDVAKYTTNFTPPPPMFGDYTRSTPNKIIFTPGSDYVLEARNTSGIITSSYSATRQWGTKPKGGIYDPYAANLVLAIPGGAVSAATSTFDVTGQIRYETPTASYVNAGIVTYSNSLGIGTYQNLSITNTSVSISSTITKYYSRSMQFNGSTSGLYLDKNVFLNLSGLTKSFTIECWIYSTSQNGDIIGINKSGSTNAVSFNLSSGYLKMTDWGSNTYTGPIDPDLFPLNQWVHVAISKNGSTGMLFVNGVLKNQKSMTSATISDLSVDTYIGNRSGGGTPITGYLTDLKVYDGIAKYTSNFTPPNQIYLT